MSNNDGTYFISGVGHWMKVLGRPVPNYDKDGYEWTFEVEPDKEGLKTLKTLGVEDRINKGEEKNRILFRHREKRADGSLNRPLAIVDDHNRPWDHSKLIGNGSKVDVKFRFVDNGPKKKASLYPSGVRVMELVPYERSEFGPEIVDEASADFRKDFDLDDPVE